jgi:hypothetical protein
MIFYEFYKFQQKPKNYSRITLQAGPWELFSFYKYALALQIVP